MKLEFVERPSHLIWIAVGDSLTEHQKQLKIVVQEINTRLINMLKADTVEVNVIATFNGSKISKAAVMEAAFRFEENGWDVNLHYDFNEWLLQVGWIE